MQYHVGAKDFTSPGFSDPDTGQKVVDKIVAAGGSAECLIFPDTAHSYWNALVPGGEEFLEKWGYGLPPQQQVQRSWQQAVAFLDKHLKHTVH